jgi:hypothetical protein
VLKTNEKSLSVFEYSLNPPIYFETTSKKFFSPTIKKPIPFKYERMGNKNSLLYFLNFGS